MKKYIQRVSMLTAIYGFLIISGNAQETPQEAPETAARNSDKAKDLQKEIEESEKTAQEKRDELAQIRDAMRRDLAEVEMQTKDEYWQLSYQLIKPATRIYFDTGEDDPGELDLFKDGNLGVSLEFACLHLDYHWRGIEVGPFAAAGISSASDATSDSVVLIWSVGLAFEMKDLPFGVEAGFMQGISADEKMNSRDRDDGAFFIGINLNKLMEKKSVNFSR